MHCTFNLNSNNNFDNILNNDETTLNNLNIQVKKCTFNNESYHIIKYNKKDINENNTLTSGLFRSVIIKNKNIVSFSPPKSVSMQYFQNNISLDNSTIEEFIEGTMINLFYDQDINEWIISTKSFIGADIRFFVNDYNKDMTFKQMFYDIAKSVNLDFNLLPKNYCYSFVIQHNNNRIVSPFKQHKLYIISVYSIDINNYLIHELPYYDSYEIFKHSKVSYPIKYEFDSYDDIFKSIISNDTPYDFVGVMIKSNNIRTKVRNPNYEYVRRLRGNQPKLQYHYLTLRKEGNINEYLKYYPDAKDKFNEFKHQIYLFTQQLYTYYIECYIHKKNPLANFPYQFKNHMFLLHDKYINELRNNNQFINKKYVIDYINQLHPAQLMFSVNYEKRTNKQTKTN
tara:strand:+ start:635 stop:1825 length:1191 start_codon:yes stop_codon:yes gene_type:complete